MITLYEFYDSFKNKRMHSSFEGKRQSGAVTIEFSIGIFIFIVFVVSIMELSQYMLIINTTESLLSESTRRTRIFESDRFEKTYRERLEEISKSKSKLWNFIIKPEELSISFEQYKSLNAINNNEAMTGCNDCPIVIYNMSYNYSPMISLGLIRSSIISRKILTVQEHEGWN